jgi:uncharacterized protein YgiM (DUF1202 family)
MKKEEIAMMRDYSMFSRSTPEVRFPLPDDVEEENAPDGVENENATDDAGEPEEPEEPEEPVEIVAVVTNCGQLNVRESDSKNSKVLRIINAGDKVKISPIQDVDIDDNWAHVELNDGTYGYVMREFIKEV